MSNENPSLYIAWLGAPFTLEECQLACALSIYVPFEDGTTMDDTTIGQVLGASSGLENVNCAGLVEHLKETDNVYPQVCTFRSKSFLFGSKLGSHTTFSAHIVGALPLVLYQTLGRKPKKLSKHLLLLPNLVHLSWVSALDQAMLTQKRTQVLNGGEQWAEWARYKYNKWLDPAAAIPGTWP